MAKITYKKLTKRFSADKLKNFFDEALPGKSLGQCENIIKQSAIIGAFDNDKLIGIARSLDDSVYGFITDVIIKPEYRGKGIGSKVVKEICSDLKKKGVKIIHCSTDKKLINFFQSAEKFGYDSNDITLYCKNF